MSTRHVGILYLTLNVLCHTSRLYLLPCLPELVLATISALSSFTVAPLHSAHAIVVKLHHAPKWPLSGVWYKA